MLSDSGLSLLGDFSAARIFASVIFSAIGLGAFVYGKKNKSIRPMIIGAVLMAYTYMISEVIMIYLIGIILTAALYFWRE